jgi:DNA (cytosine-5)-methyltransferase 1
MSIVPPRHVPYLDLFSGIGGHAIALEGLAVPVAFCEIERYPTAVLSSRFPDVPVLPDVRKLTADVIPGNPRLLTASFPCQDISVAGSGKGLDGERSGLVWEVFRVLDLLPGIEAVFMENSPALRKYGIERVIDALESRGFYATWGNLAASHIGARHRRMRIWILATKTPESLNEFTDEILRESAVRALRFPFKRCEEDISRLVPRQAKEVRSVSIKRWNGLGNAIVPPVARLAFATLLSARRDGVTGELTTLVPVVPARWSLSDVFVARTQDVASYPVLHFPGEEDKKSVVNMWVTPVHNSGHFSPTKWGHQRNRTVFATRVFHSRDTSDTYGYEHGDHISARKDFMLNIEWVETLMGFPRKWTDCSQSPEILDNDCDDNDEVDDVVDRLSTLDLRG